MLLVLIVNAESNAKQFVDIPMSQLSVCMCVFVMKYFEDMSATK